MPIVLDGKALADKICLELKERADKLKASGVFPMLTIVTSGDDAASKLYVRNKVRRAEDIGIDAEVVHYDSICRHHAWEQSMKVRPIIYQMPITGTVTLDDLDTFVGSCIDVDGFVSSRNVSAVANGERPCFYPCTPKGIMRLLSEYEITPEGKSVCIIGRSNIVGRPLARMMEQAGATVVLCHSKTPEWMLKSAVSLADIVVSATGVRNVISDVHKYINDECDYDHLRDQVFVDVGMNRDENGKLCGDIDPQITKYSKAYTPVPGGVGPMTVAMLMENVIEYYERHL